MNELRDIAKDGTKQTIACTPLPQYLRRHVESFVQGKKLLGTMWNILFYSVIPVILLLLSTAGLVGDSYNPFIYFQF